MLNEIRNFYNKTRLNFQNKDKSTPVSEWPLAWRKVFYKTYERFPQVQLKSLESNSFLTELLLSRRTTRDFSEDPLILEQVSNLLQASMGVSTSSEQIDFAKRTYPSAGARYPIEAYLVNNNVSGLNNGLYHFNVRDNSLELMLGEDLSKTSVEIVDGDLGLAPLLIFLTGVIKRSEVKYGVNAYRFSLIEAGHIGQNISLCCEQEGLGSCAIGGFDNEKVSKLLDLTEEEIPLYIFAVGKKK